MTNNYEWKEQYLIYFKDLIDKYRYCGQYFISHWLTYRVIEICIIYLSIDYRLYYLFFKIDKLEYWSNCALVYYFI